MKSIRNVYWAMIAGLFTMAIVQACSTVPGYENVDTARKSILVANAEIRGANLLLQDLARRDVISAEDAQAALQSLREAHGTLQTALSALDVGGDPVTAQSGIERANRAITLALTILSSYTGEP